MKGEKVYSLTAKDSQSPGRASACLPLLGTDIVQQDVPEVKLVLDKVREVAYNIGAMTGETRDFWTTKELAAEAGVTDGHIRNVLLAGKLTGRKVAGVWLIDDDSARAWLVSDRTPGRKPKHGRQKELDLGV